MYNLRYHVASLIAVFLALAVGLLLGTVVAERGMITDQSSALVEDLQQRFDEISAANDELRLGLERDRAFAEDAVEVMSEGRLEGMRVVVLGSTGRVDGQPAVERAVTEAGGEAILVTVREVGLGLLTTEPEGLAGYFAGRDMEMAPAGPELIEQVAESLATEWREGGEQPLSALLADAGLMDELASTEGTVTVDGIVVMAAGPDGCDPFALALARTIVADGGISVAAEAETSSTGVAATCADEGLPAVGHIGTPQGRVSLVWILSGKARGYYGPGDDVDGYYPVFGPAAD